MDLLATILITIFTTFGADHIPYEDGSSDYILFTKAPCVLVLGVFPHDNAIILNEVCPLGEVSPEPIESVNPEYQED